jgi:thiol-disulfide isomerase/thioredoxin
MKKMLFVILAMLLTGSMSAMAGGRLKVVATNFPCYDFARQVCGDGAEVTMLLKPGTEAPDFKLKTIDGKTFRLSSLRGQYVVLDFWASWCPDCRKDAPNLVRMHQQFKDKGTTGQKLFGHGMF